MYFERTISKVVLDTSETFPVVLITGPRQIGKSTVFERLKEDNRTYVTLDDPQIRMLAQTDPALFLQIYKPPVLIDEVQYAPELFPYIKMMVDKRKEKGLFWLTGSQPFQLMEKVSESLAGRVGILELQGLSQAEKNQTSVEPFLPDTVTSSNREPYTINSFYSLILKGSFPELYATPRLNKNTFYASYLKTYIERDIRNLTNVQDERLFLTFLKVTAARTGQLLNYADIAKDVGITLNTVKSWISLLLTSGLVFLLQPYHNNLTNRAVKTPKLHFMDTGLCAYLCGWTTAETLSVGAMSGAIFESYVVSEIIKSYLHHNEQGQFYFYRDKDRQEIDLIIERDNIFYPIEIKRTASPQLNDVKTFELLKRNGLTVGKGAIVCLYENLLPLNKKVWIIPVGCLG
jgi:predicted AAA+ superfamily ATPase